MENTEPVVEKDSSEAINTNSRLESIKSPIEAQSLKGDAQKQDEYDLAKAIELSLKESEQAAARQALVEVDLNLDADPEVMTSQQCPVCDVSLTLTGKSFNLHVNQCLDAPQTETTATKENPEDQSLSASSSWKDLFGLGQGKAPAKEAKETTATAAPPKPKQARGVKRECPFYKWMQDTPYVVDAFSYGKITGCDGYFLSHFHSDHYHGLSSSWSAGPIFCSQITANLVQKKLKVDPQYLHPFPMNECSPIDANVSVGLIDANHCPGSVLLLFKVRRADGRSVHHLHTGDFRANPRMCLHPLIQQPANPSIDTLYLDTTYLNPKYTFPAQEECIEAACSIVKQLSDQEESGRPKTLMESWIQRSPKEPTFDTPKPRLLVVVGTYTIGKEKVFYNIAKMLGSKLYVTNAKRDILQCLEDPELESMLTDDQTEAQVHVVPLQDIKAENMNAYFKSLEPYFSSMAAFRPTGWTFRPTTTESNTMSQASLANIVAPPSERTITLKPQHVSPKVKIYGVPYSEHSSFRELAAFIASLEIKRIVPTVNMGSEESRTAMASYYDAWQNQKKDIHVVPYPSESHW